MKTTLKNLTFFILIFYVTACTGYQPIFVNSDLNFEISDYSIVGDNTLGKELYFKVKNLSKAKKDNAKKIIININVTKNKVATAKDSAGKTLEYKINLSTEIEVKDFLNGNVLLNHSFNSSSSYRVQDQYSETISLENKNIENLLNKNFLDFLAKMSEKIK
jgi:hypothetical protein